MQTLKILADKPLVGHVIKKAIGAISNREAMYISSHFSTYFAPFLSLNEENAINSFKIRHQVYCEELGYEDATPNKLETDPFDNRSIHCLLQHTTSKKYAGTVRVVTTSTSQELLPIEKYCLESISHEKYHPTNFQRSEICEISRLAVPEEFRRRKVDQYKGASTGVINEQIYSETELRCFPFIAVGLYLSATSILLDKGISHVFVMMEPRLARSMRFVGIKFEQIGPTVEYHGKRAPYYIDPKSLLKTLSPGFLIMLQDIHKSIEEQLNKRR